MNKTRYEIFEKIFLSSNAQDFIEERTIAQTFPECSRFLSSNAQDFIEEKMAEQS